MELVGLFGPLEKHFGNTLPTQYQSYGFYGILQSICTSLFQLWCTHHTLSQSRNMGCFPALPLLSSSRASAGTCKLNTKFLFSCSPYNSLEFLPRITQALPKIKTLKDFLKAGSCLHQVIRSRREPQMLCQGMKMCHHLQYLHSKLGVCGSEGAGAGVAANYLVVSARSSLLLILPCEGLLWRRW